MKKIDRFKTIQLIIYILITAIFCLLIFTNDSLFHAIALDSNVRTVCIMLWACLGITFFFIFMDFSMYGSVKRTYRELDYAVHRDPVAGIANRYSSDAIIEKYLDRQLPESVGVIMYDLTNIKEINENHGHLQGNEAIRVFGTILSMASVDLCFVSRNGGNRFLAIFEDGSEAKLNKFIKRVESKVSEGNAIPGKIILEYKYGIAFNKYEHLDSITELISLSAGRISQDQ